MTDDKHITAGLNLLADDMTTVDVDLDAVITTARQRTRQRYAVTATTLGTLTVVAAIAVTITQGGGHGSKPPLAQAAGSSTATPPTEPSNPAWINVTIDDESRKLTTQFITARDSLIPPGFSVAADPSDVLRLHGIPVPAFEFAVAQGLSYPDPTPYTAAALLTDAQGTSGVVISVGKQPAGSPALQCSPAGSAQVNMDCSITTLPDGTQLKTFDATQGPTKFVTNNDIEAVRPDGTHITVDSDVPMGMVGYRNTPALSKADLAKFATAFTY